MVIPSEARNLLSPFRHSRSLSPTFVLGDLSGIQSLSFVFLFLSVIPDPDRGSRVFLLFFCFCLSSPTPIGDPECFFCLFVFVCHPRPDRGSRVFLLSFCFCLSSPTPIGDPGCLLFPAFMRITDTGSPKFTNEVQHLVKVLPWDATIHNSPLKTAVKWPAYTPRDTLSAKSRQLWIARHRLWLEN